MVAFQARPQPFREPIEIHAKINVPKRWRASAWTSTGLIDRMALSAHFHNKCSTTLRRVGLGSNFAGRGKHDACRKQQSHQIHGGKFPMVVTLKSEGVCIRKPSFLRNPKIDLPQ